MRRMLLALICFLALPANAQGTSVADHQALAQQTFLAQYAGQGAIGCNSNGVVQFASGTSQQNIAAVNAAAAQWDWSGSALYLPDIIGFVQDIRSEPSFTAQIRDNLSKLLGNLQDASTPSKLQQDWSDACNNPDNAAWLTPTVQNTIMTYATNRHIPL